MNKEIKVRIILRHNTTEGWGLIGDSEILFKGEIGLEFLSGSNIPKIKIGDGISPWNRLQYFSVDIPDKYTWNDLLGLDLVKEASLTTNLSLKKPGYSDVVNLKDLNENYDILDSANEQILALIRTLTSRLDNLITEYPDGELGSVEQEVYNMRTRYNGVVYESAATAMQAIDEDLSKLSEELSKFVGSSIPDGLYYKDNLLYLTSGGEIISDPVEVIGGSGGGGGNASSYVVNLTNLLDTRVLSVAAGNPVALKFNYSSADAEGYTDGNGVGALFVNNIQQTTFIVPQGDFTLYVEDYLKDGSNTVKIQVTNSEGAYRSLSYTVNILTLSITSPSALMNLYNSDAIQTVNFQYTVNGSGTKNVYFLMDGKEIKKEVVTSTGQNRQYIISAQPDGAHIFEVYATSDAEGETIYSNKIRIGMIWYSSKTINPIILFNTELKEITQGETISIPYMIFHPDAELAPITREILYDRPILDEEGNETGETERSVYVSDNPNVGREGLEWTTQDFPAGDNVEFKISCGGVSESVIIKVLASTFDREIYKERLLLEFSALGKENTDPNPASWKYEDIEAEFSSNISWSEMDGWLKDKEGQSMLRLLPKSTMSIPFKPFEKEITTTGYTIEVELATQNVNDYDSIITSSFTNDRGLLIKSQSARLKSSQSDIEVQFREDQRIRLTFVIEQGGETATRLIYVYINGILCGVQQYPNSASFRQTAPGIPAVGLTIGAESCGIDVYFIRFYDIAFNADMQLNNFMVDRSSLAERIEIDQRNDIIDVEASDVHKRITIESLKGAIPYIVMQCPELPQYKGDKKKKMKMYYVDPKNPEKNFSATGCQFDVQGTSSQYYPVKNFKISFKEGITYDKSGQYSDGFEFTDNSLPSATLCLKADFASSENANNVNLVDLYNDITSYIMPPQQADERVRQGVYGQPIVLFWENTDTKEISFEGKYNMNDDKSNENVFGFVDIDFSSIIPTNKQRIECWEWKNNNTAYCLFQEDSGWNEIILDAEDNTYKPAWQASFEPRFPDTDPMYDKTDALYRVISWVVSTRTDRATSAPLSTPKYYITRDVTWNPTKTYYLDDTGTVATITPKGDTLSYSTDAAVNRDIFYEKMGATSYEELVGGYTFILNEETNLWSLFKGEENILIASDIDNIGLYGVSLSGSITSFAFEYKIVGEGWAASLYEYFDKDTAEYRLSKFKDEFSNYFVLDAMLFYYIFTETFLMIDNRAKNMFLTTFDGLHWFPIPYDMDTAMGINNSGQLIFDYNLEDTDFTDGVMTFDGINKLYDGKNTYTGSLNGGKFITDEGKEIDFTGAKVYNGQDSILWINFRKCFNSEIRNEYQSVRTNKKEFSNDFVANKINTYQQAWAEVIWNLDQEIKFLQPFFAGKDYLKMAQGNKQAQRDFWLYNAFKYRDSKYQTGDAKQNSILIRLYDKGEINVIPYSHIYTRVQFGSAKDETKRTWRNEVAKFTTEGIAAVNDLETYIYSADRISDLGDLSNFKIGLCDFSYATKLQRIILGRYEDGYTNGNLKSFTLGASDLLQEIDISKCYNLKSTVEAGQCPCLEVFKARGSGISGVTFSNGGRLRIVNLPETVTNLTLRNQTQLEELTIDSFDIIESLNIENTPNVPFEDIIFNSSKISKVRLYNVEWHTTEDRLNNLIDKLNQEGMTNIDSSDKPTVVGRVYLDSISEELLLKANESFHQLIVYVKEGNDYKAKYFLNYLDSKNNIVYSYIAEEDSDAIDPVETGKIDIEDIELSDPTENTRYFYNGWRDLPKNIKQSWTIRVKEGKEYLVNFYDIEGNLYEEEGVSQWIREGENAIDPTIELISTPTQKPSAQYSYIYKEWNHSLENISGPLQISPVFEEVLNSYIVEFYTNLPRAIKTEEIFYGEYATGPNLDDVKYYISADINRPSELHECIGWDRSLLIMPDTYQAKPIRLNAQFNFLGNINNVSWTEIATNAAAGNLDAYGIGSQKDIEVVINGNTYTITMELVAKNFDKLVSPSENYSSNSNYAAFTFVAKNIGWTRPFNEGEKTFTDPEFGTFSGPTAGGWYNSDIRNWSNNVLFNSLIPELKEAIKEVVKIGDIGRPQDLSINVFDGRLISSNDFIWLLSSTELGITDRGGLTLQQSAQYDAATGTYLSYDWFTDNESRIKMAEGLPRIYFTRTHSPNATHRFLTILKDGSCSNETAGSYLSYVFGFCI